MNAINEFCGLFTSLEPDAVGEILGTGFVRFETPFGISGLVRVSQSKLEFLAVIARVEGRGAFRTLIEQSKKRCAVICVWEIWNPVLDAALERYGFARATQREPDGEILSGWIWEAR